MMEAAPAAPLKMRKPNLLLELLIVTLDAPAQFGEIDQTSKGNILRQCREPVFGRLLLPFGPFDQQPFFRPGLAAIEVAFGDAYTHARKARSERHICPLSPGDRAPSVGRQAKGEVLDLDRPMRRIAAQALGRPTMARLPGLGGQGAGAGSPDRGIRQNAGHIRQFKRRNRRPSALLRAASPPRRLHGFDQAQSAALSQSRSHQGRPPSCAARRQTPTPLADTNDRPLVGLHACWPATATPRPGNCPVYRAGRNIAALRPPNACPSWESLCRQ